MQITYKDLGQPFLVWWQSVPWRKTPILTVSWPGLIVIGADPEWPDGFTPSRLDGWGKCSFRFAKVRNLPGVRSLPDVPVPNLEPVLDLKRGHLQKGKPGLRSDREIKFGERGVYLGMGDRSKIRRALGTSSSQILEFRLFESEEPEGLKVIVYKSKRMRVIASVSEGE